MNIRLRSQGMKPNSSSQKTVIHWIMAVWHYQCFYSTYRKGPIRTKLSWYLFDAIGFGSICMNETWSWTLFASSTSHTWNLPHPLNLSSPAHVALTLKQQIHVHIVYSMWNYQRQNKKLINLSLEHKRTSLSHSACPNSSISGFT